MNVVLEIHNDFLIDEQSYVEYNQNDNACFKEYFCAMGSWHKNAKRIEYCDIIAFFLASNNELTDKEDLKLLENLNTLADLTLELPKDYDFSYLIPPVEVYKEIIEEYCARMDPRKLAPLQKEIKDLKLFGTATQRIHNHLSYKLGQIMIRNSKSFFGFIKMPYLLIAVTLAHKEQEKIYKEKIKANPNLALSPLESYKDYQALKEKECLTYKLGEAFIKATKTWYKGGFIKFFFEVKLFV
ncbi:MAG: hypothetical protein J1E31_01555 [Helicobacter sp.]|nr:hypothetical protein [Helicobacter sp.]